MITIRRSQDRGRADFGWLNSHHTFSFGDYYDPAHMGFGPLRVINDDRVSPGGGFSAHPHRDMEILSYVVEGALEHKDSIGNGSVITPGELQRMTAGTGVIHSEYNLSRESGVRFLQIWIMPEKRSLDPGYEQKRFGDERRNALRLVASSDGAQGSLTVHQDVKLYASLLEAGQSLTHSPDSSRKLWLQMVHGEVKVGEDTLREGDGLAAENGVELTILAKDDANFLLFDLAQEAA